MSRVVAFDHGSRRIGVAVADTEVGQAFARAAVRVPRTGAIGPALSVAQAEGATEVVVGLPRNMDGSEGRQAAAARRFADALAHAGLSVVLVDERLTSWQAYELLADAGRRPSRQSGELDSAAARLILQEYLDARAAPHAAAQAPNHREAR